MSIVTPSKYPRRTLAFFLGLFSLQGLVASSAHAEGGFIEAVTGGKVSGQLRPRFEWVDQEGKSKTAQALTLRTQLGYTTGDYKGFGALLQFEDVRSLGGDEYNDTINGLTQYPTIADPESTEVNQAFLSYKGAPDTLLADTVIKYGRQIINLDNQRFIGDVGWRQNTQTFDALSLTSSVTNNVNLFLAHVTNVNRVFGENHPTLSDVEMKGELINMAYRGLPLGTLTGYAYLLNYEPGQPLPPSASNKTLGLRFDGWRQQEGGTKYFYTAEYANQSDYQDGASTVDADYKNLALGAEIQGIQAKLNYEVLSGDGVYGFATPLATLHAFNGWSDQFLTTPKDGLQDIFVTLAKSWKGINWFLRYDRFSSDNGGYDYGSEWGVSAARKMNKNLTLSAKYATYSGDTNTTNVARNLTLARDLEKVWLQADFQF
ncbi:MAG: alginate export family protein [Gammaproteobacteria bacterium]